MTQLYPGILPIAAERLARIHGSYADMTVDEQLQFVTELRAARKRGSSVTAIKERKGAEHGKTAKPTGHSVRKRAKKRDLDQGSDPPGGDQADNGVS